MHKPPTPLPKTHGAPGRSSPRVANHDPAWVRWLLIGLVYAVMGVLVVVPLVLVFVSAFADGPAAYVRNLFFDPDTRHAALLTLIVAPTAVAANVLFGVAAAWAVARFRFPGRTLLMTLLDMPFAISPVAAGLMFILLYGRNGYIGQFLDPLGFKIIFSLPGMILVTTFTTLPFIARELIPVMEAIGSDEEVAAVSLGATGWQMFWKVTLPNIKWGLLYGVILCNARALGEFGAVFVVSSRIAGLSDTLPLRIEKLNQDYQSAAA
ncbi:MAG: sulfate ABC transporter permease, partial [Planctomycetia bacterium]